MSGPRGRVEVVGEGDLLEAVEAADGGDVRVYSISTAGRSDRRGFFDAVRESLPLDPPLAGSRSWDALADSLWGGINSLGGPSVLIIWRGSAGFRELSPDEYGMACDVLNDVAESLGDPAATAGDPKNVTVFIVQD
ncbi:barstar family protein [Thermomonospora cellulosilytica]|uniref:Barstar (barnase inhibitor) domain-containing protein n=1 Tax=Thermomonospora cellulosilytica TaxID=1411118 RepID=A0A7W3N461_9ACTN|nr:barstar family protein [Thermomonospora cellulosilytica]MBA9007219.1 hypothetical protein [Thermomonospora cellulosilytica]